MDTKRVLMTLEALDVPTYEAHNNAGSQLSPFFFFNEALLNHQIAFVFEFNNSNNSWASAFVAANSFAAVRSSATCGCSDDSMPLAFICAMNSCFQSLKFIEPLRSVNFSNLFALGAGSITC